jgi:hypothetical protein
MGYCYMCYVGKLQFMKPKIEKRIDYETELLNLYFSLYFACIFLYSVHFKLFFNSRKHFVTFTAFS